jgi:hypothetical protein
MMPAQGAAGQHLSVHLGKIVAEGHGSHEVGHRAALPGGHRLHVRLVLPARHVQHAARQTPGAG